MKSITCMALMKENHYFRGTSGISDNNRQQGFRPAFKNIFTGQVHLSRFADGSPAPIHLIDGLPYEWVIQSDPISQTRTPKPSIQSGFLLGGRFFTREQAAAYKAVEH